MLVDHDVNPSNVSLPASAGWQAFATRPSRGDRISGFTFWIVGGMEMVERLAFYGVKAVSALYATAPRVEGGLGVSPVDLATF